MRSGEATPNTGSENDAIVISDDDGDGDADDAEVAAVTSPNKLSKSAFSVLMSSAQDKL